jgi:cytochrome c556
MRPIIAIAFATVVASTAAFAAVNASINERREHFEAFGKAVKAPVKMFKGEEAFDLAVVQAALKTIQEKAPLLPKLFPDDSKVGEDSKGEATEALPAIWDNKPDFEDRFAKLGEGAKVAATSIVDEATFKTAFKDVLGNCSGCHKKYREEKK